jgi:molybdopterin-guanine dinucleotide biosynthesis protein A
VANRDVAGCLLVGGESKRFGSPKALAVLDGETLAERAHRALTQAFETVIVVGKEGDALPLPFPVRDDGSDERAAIVGVAASIRLAGADICVVLPTDMPFVTPGLLRSLAQAVEDVDAAVVPTGPLPGAYRRSSLALLESRIAAGELALYRALEDLEVRVVEADPALLRNVNEPGDLTRTS